MRVILISSVLASNLYVGSDTSFVNEVEQQIDIEN